MSNHILLVGATGAVGQIFASKALAAGYKLTLYVRSPNKVPEALSKDPNVTILEGRLDDKDGLVKAAQSGATIFVSFAGPSAGVRGTPLGDAYAVLYPLLIENHFDRVLVLSTPSYAVSEDKGAFKWTALVAAATWIGGDAVKEMRAIGQVTSSQPVEQLKWTVFRVPMLTNGAEVPVAATYTGSGADSIMLTRAGTAQWVLTEISENKWVGKAPLLCNA